LAQFSVTLSPFWGFCLWYKLPKSLSSCSRLRKLSCSCCR